MRCVTASLFFLFLMVSVVEHAQGRNENNRRRQREKQQKKRNAKAQEIAEGVTKINNLIDSFGNVEHCDCHTELEDHYERNLENLETFSEQAVIHFSKGDAKKFQFQPIKCEPQKGQVVAKEGGEAALSQESGDRAASEAVVRAEAGGMEITCRFKASFYSSSYDRTVSIDGIIQYRPDKDCPPTDATTPCVRLKIEKAEFDKSYFFHKDVTDKVLDMAEELDYDNVKVSEDHSIVTFEKLKSEKE